MSILMLKLLWGNFKMWIWQIWWGDEAFLLLFKNKYEKGDVFNTTSNRVIILRDGKLKGGNYEHIVKPYRYRT